MIEKLFKNKEEKNKSSFLLDFLLASVIALAAYGGSYITYLGCSSDVGVAAIIILFIYVMALICLIGIDIDIRPGKNKQKLTKKEDRIQNEHIFFSLWVFTIGTFCLLITPFLKLNTLIFHPIVYPFLFVGIVEIIFWFVDTSKPSKGESKFWFTATRKLIAAVEALLVLISVEAMVRGIRKLFPELVLRKELLLDCLRWGGIVISCIVLVIVAIYLYILINSLKFSGGKKE